MNILVQTFRTFAVVELSGDKIATEVEATTAKTQEIKAHMIEINPPKTNHGVEEGFSIPLCAWASRKEYLPQG